MSARQAKRLRAGEAFRMDDGSVWEVLRVTDCSASVRCTAASARQLGTRHVDFADGRSIEVPVWSGTGHKTGETLTIAPCAMERDMLPRDESA